MSKAEDRAIEKYPVEMYEEVGWRCVDKNADKRQYFIEGYHQAEKDLELTWEDISKIIFIEQQVCGVMKISDYVNNYQQAMEEVLKRFKQQH